MKAIISILSLLLLLLSCNDKPQNGAQILEKYQTNIPAYTYTIRFAAPEKSFGRRVVFLNIQVTNSRGVLSKDSYIEFNGSDMDYIMTNHSFPLSWRLRILNAYNMAVEKL